VAAIPSRCSETATAAAGAGFFFREARTPLRKFLTLRIVISPG